MAAGAVAAAVRRALAPGCAAAALPRFAAPVAVAGAGAACQARAASSGRPARGDDKEKETWGRKYNIVRWLFKIDDKKEQELRDANVAERERLKKQLSDQMNRGYFGDFGEIGKNNGKRFTAPERIAKAAESPVFPTIEAESLAGPTVRVPDAWRGKVTFVAVGFRAFSKPMIEGYRAAFDARFARNPGCQLCELSVVDSFMMRKLLSGSIKANMRAEAKGDEARLASTLCYTGPDAQSIKERLGVFNSATGYGFLVDKQGRIRWRVHGHLEDGEVTTLARCVSELLSSSR